MEINLLNQKNSIKLEGYGKDKFIVSGKEYNYPILILPNDIKKKKRLKISDLNKKMLGKIILENKLDFLILGINEKIDKKISLRKSKKIVVMDTRAACRTLNILFSEERIIGALLFPIN